MNQFEPEEVTHKGHDKRLVDEGGSDRCIELGNPCGLKEKAHHQENGNGKEELIQKGIDGMNFLCHEFLDIESRRSPQEGSHNLQKISKDHRGFGGFRPPSENGDDASESQNQTCNLRKA
jgi:hypothetical protein